MTDFSTPDALLGLSERHLVEVAPLACKLHPAVVEPLAELQRAAAEAGFDLKVASSFRSFERQLMIWNAKACGERPVLDDAGTPLDLASLTNVQKIVAIMRWSALPGASRHHWGTDLDVYDGAAIPADYRLQLTVAECVEGGPFAEFHRWLMGAIADGRGFGFYRPYASDRGGVAPEPWHLSYAPIARKWDQARTEALLRQQLLVSDLSLKDCVLENLSELYVRFVQVPD